MSQQRGPTLNDVELQYHSSKTDTDALVVTLLKEYKFRLSQLAEQNQKLQEEVKLYKKDPKPEEEEPKEAPDIEEKPNK